MQKKCERCCKEFTDRSRGLRGRFCSRSCRGKAIYWAKRAQRLLRKTCPNCNKEFETIRRKHTCCSLKCQKAKYQKENRGDTYKPSRELVYKDKIAKGCSRCPEKRPSCLQYHHLDPTTKIAGVGTLSQSKPPVIVAAEMEKCILLCANCHFVEENGDGYKDEDRNVEKEYHREDES